MSVILDQDLPGVPEAEAKLAEMEKSTAAAEATESQAAPEQRESGADRAGAGQSSETQTPASKQSDTPAAPAAPAKAAETANDKSQTDKTKAGEKPVEPAKGADGKSKYAKGQERLEKTWDDCNRRKADLDTQTQTLTQRENALKMREADFQRQQEQAQAQHKPEEYESAAAAKLSRAQSLNLQADGLDARAVKLEDAGKDREAEDCKRQAQQLRKQAHKEEGNAEDLRAHADNLRKNPPPSAKQREDAITAQSKEWTMKAATQFPELAKQGSDLQKVVAAHLNKLSQDDPVLSNHPSVIYHVTRLAAAETAAARVPGLEKELGEAKAKVKELEALTSPGGPGSVQQQSAPEKPKSDDEERAELGQLASQLGTIPG